jgi:hypothetical protein
MKLTTHIHRMLINSYSFTSMPTIHPHGWGTGVALPGQSGFELRLSYPGETKLSLLAMDAEKHFVRNSSQENDKVKEDEMGR